MKNKNLFINIFCAVVLFFTLIITCLGVAVKAASFEEKLPFAAQKLLTMYGKTSDDIKQINKIIDPDSGQITRVITEDNLVIDVVNDNIQSFSFFTPIDTSESICVYRASDYATVISQIKQLSQIDKSYEVNYSDSFDEDYWRLTLEKSYDRVINPYESVNVVINRRTGDIVSYRKFDEAPTSFVAHISQNDALNAISDLLYKLNVEPTTVNITMAFEKKNFDEYTNSIIPSYGNVRLTYKLSFCDGHYNVFVDAETGEVIAYSEMRDVAQAFSVSGQPAFPAPATQTTDATSCFHRLGYKTMSPYYSNNPMRIQLINYLNRQDAYGFYLACHGNKSQTKLSGPGWSISREDISGNWKFVFLDACYSGDGTGWADCFNITNSSKNRAFLGWFDTVDGRYATQFTGLFFYEVTEGKHSNNIRDAAIWAASQVPGAGTTPIRFYGDRTYRGFL